MKKLILLALISLSIFSCKDQVTHNNDNLYKYRAYIYQTTSGRISVQDPIQITLAKDISNYEANTVLKDGVLSISPQIKGKFIVLDKRHIEVIPEKKLKPNTEYTVKIALNKLLSRVPRDFKKFQFQFKTIEQNFVINTHNLQSYSKEWQYLQGSLQAADVMDISVCKTCLLYTSPSPRDS